MNELAKKLGIELKPFCVRSDEFPSAQICQDMLERCATLGSDRHFSVFETEKPNYYTLGYRLLNCHYWGVIYNNRTFTSNDFLAFASNLLSYQQMLDYLQLTEKDGRLIPNEEIIKENKPMYTLDVASGKVRFHKFPDNACTEAPTTSSEPVSMIKGKVVEGDTERLLQLFLGLYEGDEVVYSRTGGYACNRYDFLVDSNIDNFMSEIEDYCLKSEYVQITLDKQLKEAEEQLLKAQAKVDELKKRKSSVS